MFRWTSRLTAPLSCSKSRLPKSQGPEYAETSSNNSLVSKRQGVSVDDSECLWNSSVNIIQAHKLNVRDDQYDTGSKVLTLPKGHWRNVKKSFKVWDKIWGWPRHMVTFMVLRHIPIKWPRQNLQDYFWYKQYWPLNIPAICDSKG